MKLSFCHQKLSFCQLLSVGTTIALPYARLLNPKKEFNMNFNTFTIKAQEAVQTAQQIAQQYGHQELQCEHFFKAIEQVDENVLPFLFKKLNINREQLSKTLEATLQSFPKVTGGSMGISREANTMLNEASSSPQRPRRKRKRNGESHSRVAQRRTSNFRIS